MNQFARIANGVAVALVSAFLLSACASNAPRKAADTGADCQIIYSPIPHMTSGHIVGQQRLERTFALSDDDKRRFFRTLGTITEDLFATVADPAAVWELQAPLEIIGGYEGESLPSISLRLNSRGSGNIQQLAEIASAMGYVYVQDSVLVECADDGIVNATDAINVIATDAGRRTFLDTGNARVLYGIMIALNNGTDDLGYSYYSDTGRFEALEQDAATGKTEQLLQHASRRLARLSSGAVKLAVSTEKLDLAFPHNAWSVDKNGEAYVSGLSPAVDPADLLQYRQRFLQALDAFIDRPPQE